ncbi:jerky protein homolog-like [Mercenaria mercenaria]|uniref:jerky protein homolog-like n=1 Tax=Mercenaria mercenaria TaxID=6596 RepID=UPI00234FAA34|nr:jerky protein homolog-like [Mercenaria mercenaria]
MSFLRLPTIGKATKRRRLYDTGLIARAYKDVVSSGMSVYKAARLYGIPESTLRDRTLGLQPVTGEKENLPSSGPPPTFTAQEEQKLEGRNSDPDFAASWYKGFKRRNPDVTLAKPQKLSVLRAKCTSDKTMDKYFCELAKVLKKHDLENHPEFIWNVDETGLMMEHNPRHVICMKGTTPQAITSNRGKTVTIIASGSAAGIRLPPYYVFPGMRWNQDLLTGASPGSVGTVTESGWSNSAVFMEYLEQHFLKHVSTKDHPVIILFDGHKSHVNLTLSTWGEANNVVFFVLPPHTSHVTQPLDVGCFGPLKNIYHSECQAYMRRNPGMQINRCNIAEISSKAYNKGVCAENLISAFKKTGVYPLQRTSIGAAKTTPSTIYIENKEQPISEPAESVSFLERKKILKVLEKTKVPERGSLPSWVIYHLHQRSC